MATRMKLLAIEDATHMADLLRRVEEGPRFGAESLAKNLELAKVNFQVLRRIVATLAQTKGSVKGVQTILGHRKVDDLEVYLAADR